MRTVRPLLIRLIQSFFFLLLVSGTNASGQTNNLIINGSFGNPVIPTGYICASDGSPYLALYPSCGTVPGWTGDFQLTTGLFNGAPIGGFNIHPPFPGGGPQILILQSVGPENIIPAATSFATQTVTLPADGQYTLSWQDALRPFFPQQTYLVFLDATTLGTYSPALSWVPHSVSFQAIAGAHDITFQTVPGNATAGIDVVSLSCQVCLSISFGIPGDSRPFEMFDRHTAQVNVTGHFSQDPTTAKSLSVSATINGTPVTSVFPLQPTDIGDQPKSLFIDLAANGVPMFDDNQEFTITATITEGGQTASDQADGEIPLPVVHVHGILTDCLPDRIPHFLFAHLHDVHPSYTEDDGFPNLTKPYPTLVSFSYSSGRSNALLAAIDLAQWVRATVLPATYANKVNIVAHSMGGIVTRVAIADDRLGSAVRHVVLVGSPTDGATLAQLALNDWSAIKLLVATLALVPGVQFVPDYETTLGCLLLAGQTTATQLLPTYNWWAPTKAQALQGSLQNPSINPLLPQLNGLLDPSVDYLAIVASGVITPTLGWGRSFWLGGPTSSLTDLASWGAGDGVVPISSQSGADARPGQITVFGDAGAVGHIHYFDQGSPAINFVERALWP